MNDPGRRRLLAWGAASALPFLGACAHPLPPAAAGPLADDPEALRWLRESAERHGWSAYQKVGDINVSYSGRWRPLIDRLQPELVDKPWRESSEERLQPRLGLMAQAHRGPAGHKQVFRQRGASPQDLGQVAVWYDQQPAEGSAARTAAALVADCYALFLLGPLWLLPQAGGEGLRLSMGAPVEVDGQDCRWVQSWLSPGLGMVARDRVDLAIDQRDRTLRRLRFTLEGFAGTQGAVAETDHFEHQRLGGILWPMRFFERVVRPLGGLPAHDWRVTGLDLDRGWDAAAVQGPRLEGAAARAARPLG